MERREFLKRLGATGLMIAGSTAGGFWLHNRKTGMEESEVLPHVLPPLVIRYSADHPRVLPSHTGRPPFPTTRSLVSLRSLG